MKTAQQWVEKFRAAKTQASGFLAFIEDVQRDALEAAAYTVEMRRVELLEAFEEDPVDPRFDELEERAEAIRHLIPKASA